jgi:hypothetical protein
MQKQTANVPEIKLVPRSKLLAKIDISTAHLKQGIMPQLTKGIHYFDMPGGHRFLYNEPLILDFIVNGNSEAHQRACDAFVRSLASSHAA